MRDMGEFARKAQVYATSHDAAGGRDRSAAVTSTNATESACVGSENCVRALYGLTRSEAYVVGEYEMDLLGRPKLIIAPSLNT
jgi:hypothetical protein